MFTTCYTEYLEGGGGGGFKIHCRIEFRFGVGIRSVMQEKTNRINGQDTI